MSGKYGSVSAILILALLKVMCGSAGARDGDLNGDGFINFNDLEVISEQWLSDNCCINDWCNELDLDRSDRVDLADFSIWAGFWAGIPDPLEEIENQIDALISQMTLEEKVEQMGGDPSGFSTSDNTRLGIPGLLMSDGPQGVRWGVATCFPSPMALGASWDAALTEEVGAAMGREFRGKGRYVGLAPCLNIIRDARGGRSFETSGEDPYLSSKIAPAYVRGMQSEKVIACPKHFACNNQENGRFTNDVQVNERTLREIYLPAFKACVKQADAWSVMSAYNRVNGDYCSASSHLLTDILKNEWGFKGFVVSDWGACHSTVKSANAGLDLEMPTADYFGQPLIDAVDASQVSMATIDDSVRRILRTKFYADVFDNPVVEDPCLVDTPEHRALALEASKKSIVLFKNDTSILPFNEAALTSIAVIGPNGDVARPSGGGSVFVTPPYSVSPLEGIQNRAGGGVTVDFALGCTLSGSGLYPVGSSVLKPAGGSPYNGLNGDYYNNTNLTGSPAVTRIDETVDFDWGAGSPAEAIDADGFSVRWTGKLVPETTGLYEIGTTTDDGSRLWVNGVSLVDDWTDHAATTNSGTISLTAGVEYDITFEYYENAGDAVAKLVWAEPNGVNTLMDEAVQLAAASDVAVVCVGTDSSIESEGFDRDTLNLPGLQDDLILAVAGANPNTVVVVVSGSAILMNDWIDEVNSVIGCWFGGQEVGNAVAAVLFGDENPAAKLPLTIPVDANQLAPFNNTYEAEGNGPGYRYYDRNHIDPLFVFGHGLSYTTFGYSNLNINPPAVWNDGGEVDISFDLQNTGSVAGDEVVQLYITDVNSSVLRAVKELKGFEKVTLSPSQTKNVTLTVAAGDLAFYDVNSGTFVVEGGVFDVKIGSSSSDIRLTGSFDVISVGWSQPPVSSGPNSITMTAVTSDGNDAGREFYFQCVGGGGHDSGWQPDSAYEDTNLNGNTLYCYHVKSRDINNHRNVTEWSSQQCAVTYDDQAPLPNPPTWAAAPYAVGASAVSMAATDGNDPSGVEYSFICTAGGGHDSGWQDSPVYTDTGLVPDTLYSYRIQLRDKSISANTTALSATGSATTDPDPADYLVGYWKLDESSGGIASDDSGNGYSGTLFGDPVWMPAGGWIDGAIDLDGAGDYIRIEDEAPFDITDVITVSAWIKVTSFDNDWAGVVTKGDSAWRLARSYGGSNMEFSCTGISNNQYGYISGNINVDDGAWHHVAGVYDGSRIYLYIDGVEDASEPATGSIDLNNYKVFIGENGQATGRTWNGYIDDVRVYHRALTAPDILSIYQGNL